MYRGTEAGDIAGMSPKAAGNRVPVPRGDTCRSLEEKSLRASLLCYTPKQGDLKQNKSYLCDKGLLLSREGSMGSRRPPGWGWGPVLKRGFRSLG